MPYPTTNTSGQTKPTKSAPISTARLPGFSSIVQTRTLRAPRAARRSLANASVRPEFKNIVDEEHVAVAHRQFDVAEDFHGTARHRPVHVTRQVKKLDLRLEPDPMQGAQEVRREHEGPLENCDHQEVFRLRCGDFPGERLRSLGDRPFVEQNLDLSRAAHGLTR